MARGAEDGARSITAEGIADQIGELIYSGEIRPGDRLVEEELAQWFGVSRGPIRDAIRVLSSTGMAVLRRNRGAVVARPELTRVLEIYAIRRSIGSFAIAYACSAGVIADDAWAGLDASLERLGSIEARGSQQRMAQRDLDFQSDLIAATRLERAAEIFRVTAMDIRFFITAFTIPYDAGRHAAIMRAHRGLLESVRAGDAARAQQQWLDLSRANTREFSSYFADEDESDATRLLTSYLLSGAEADYPRPEGALTHEG